MPIGNLRIEQGRFGKGEGSLRNYLKCRLAELLDGSGNGTCSAEVPREIVQELGENAAVFEALADRLIRGAIEELDSNSSDRDALVDSLLAQLGAVLAGMRSSAGTVPSKPANAVEPEGRPHMLQSELWRVVNKIRDSGDLAYGRECGLPELDRRILFLLSRCGDVVPADVSLSLGVDKAQVSRSVKRLLADRLIDRDQLRSPLRLTEEGRELTERLLVVADLRDRELIFDIAPQELNDFKAMLATLLDRAILLYDKESEQADEPDELRATQRRMSKLQLDNSRIISPLMTLLSYLSRSGALSSKRTTGLSNFEAWVLSEISFDPPTEWKHLVDILQRDHSQAGRTVNALIERGLVNREGRPGRRHGRFSPTGEGARLYQLIIETGKEREAFLTAPMEESQMTEFMATFEKLRHNAIAQLDRERAIRELARR